MNPDTLRRMFASGMTQTQIARALGTSDTAIYAARKRHGIPYSGKHGPAEAMPADAFRALVDRGLSAPQIAARTGYHPHYVYAKAQRMGMVIGARAA